MTERGVSYTVTGREGRVRQQREGRVLHCGRERRPGQTAKRGACLTLWQGAKAGSDSKERGVSYTVAGSEGGVRQAREGRVLHCDRERRRCQTGKRGACLTL